MSISASRQNELPNNVDYRRKVQSCPVTVIQDEDLGGPMDCAYDASNDRVYVTDTINDRVMVFDSNGRNAHVFYANPNERPISVAVSTDARFVYVVTPKSLLKVKMNGVEVKTIKSYSKGDFKDCYYVCCHGDFTLVLDHGRKSVVVFDQDLEEIRCFGSENLNTPFFLAVGRDGSVYVTDWETSCVQVFSWEGRYLQTFRTQGEDDISGIAVDGDNNVLVARPTMTQISDHIDVYNAKRQLVVSIGTHGEAPGQLHLPKGMCLTPDGGLIVAEYGNKRVQIF